MGAQYQGYLATIISDGETFIYEDLKTGIVFTCNGSLPDSDEIEHVEKYHNFEYCPVWRKPGKTACQLYNNIYPCHDSGLAGKW